MENPSKISDPKKTQPEKKKKGREDGWEEWVSEHRPYSVITIIFTLAVNL